MLKKNTNHPCLIHMKNERSIQKILQSLHFPHLLKIHQNVMKALLDNCEIIVDRCGKHNLLIFPIVDNNNFPLIHRHNSNRLF